MKTSDIEAGLKTRRAVADVLGLRWIEDLKDHPDLSRTGAYLPDRPLTDYNWVPSDWDTNWNSAMWAAERFGLLKDNRLGEGGWSTGAKWHIHWRNDVASSVADGPTGPLAICRAILALNREGT